MCLWIAFQSYGFQRLAVATWHCSLRGSLSSKFVPQYFIWIVPILKSRNQVKRQKTLYLLNDEAVALDYNTTRLTPNQSFFSVMLSPAPDWFYQQLSFLYCPPPPSGELRIKRVTSDIFSLNNCWPVIRTQGRLVRKLLGDPLCQGVPSNTKSKLSVATWAVVVI